MANAIAEQREFIDKLITERDKAKSFVRTMSQRDNLRPGEREKVAIAKDIVKALSERIDDERGELSRLGADNVQYLEMRGDVGGLDRPGSPANRGAETHLRSWSSQTAETLRRMAGESRAVVSGSLDVPSLVEEAVSPIPRPTRLIDLLVNRKATPNAYEYYQQSIRVTNAAPVADNQLKPTSVYTVTPIQDRCRVVAHLSEAAPIRIWTDIPAFSGWLTSEMTSGVLDAVERQVIQGSGSGENFSGLLNLTLGTTPLTTQISFTTDVVTTLRTAQTALQLIGVQPNAWVLNPVDAQAIDLVRWSTGGGFLTGGYEHDNRTGVSGSSDNVFGTIPRVVSPSVPAGTAVLADWTQARLYIAEAMRLDIDTSGPLFQRNQFQLRAETRANVAFLQPISFAVISLH